MNVAYGLGNLGIRSALLTHLGVDDRGARVAAHLQSVGVELWPGSIVSETTSTATARLDTQGVATYSFDLRWSIPAPVDLNHLAAVHIGSIGAILEPGSRVVRDVFESAPPNTLRSYDPNIRPGIMGSQKQVLETFEDLAHQAHIVKLSDEDASWLYPGRPLDKVARTMISSGAAVVAITRGSNGCLISSSGVQIEHPANAVTVADTIGAGDAFMSGMLFAVLTANLVPTVLTGFVGNRELSFVSKVALASAEVAVSRAGAAPPTRPELRRAMLR